MKQLADKIFYGGDYNPDQWDEDTIEEDMRMFRQAGINLVTLPVFSWAKLEPDEGQYEFGWLDQLMDKFAENGISVCLATPTTAQPAWLSARYPEVLPVDIAGRKRTHGMRVFFCYNSLKYRERAAAIAEQMAMRYKDHPALAIWHVSNEYGTYCYCPNCQAKFRKWLKERYGSIIKLNECWHTSFWGRTVYSFEEIMLPTELNDDYRFNPAVQLDYQRFVTDSTVECFLNEYRIIKKYCPDIPVQTNMSGFIKKLDQFEFTKHMDILGWDNYPAPVHERSLVAMKLDLMRGLKGGQSFMLTEQSPNQQNWQPYNKLKKPGEVRRLSYQAMARGADTCLFFQLRQSVAGQEKFHGAVISHAGRSDTRVFEECRQLGAELKMLGDVFVGGRTPARVGILFDWNNWWALENSSGPTKDMDYLEIVRRFYKPFYDRNIAVTILPFTSSLENYDLIVAPMAYMMKKGMDENIRSFVKQGGTLIASFLTGVSDENDRCVFGAYPGPLRDVLGMWVEESDALFPEEKNEICIVSNEGLQDSIGQVQEVYECNFLCDRIRTETAQTLAIYGKDFYQGEACITVNAFGNGSAYYIGTLPEDRFLGEMMENITKRLGISAPYAASADVEVACREKNGETVVFAINHGKDDGWIDFGAESVGCLPGGERNTGKTVIKSGDVQLFLKK